MNKDQEKKLQEERNIWVATVRPNGRPHMTPVWFAFWNGRIYICISSRSIKARNLEANPEVAVALENGNTPLIAEGQAKPVLESWPGEVAAVFQKKYDWDINSDADYDLLVEIRPRKWIAW